MTMCWSHLCQLITTSFPGLATYSGAATAGWGHLTKSAIQNLHTRPHFAPKRLFMNHTIQPLPLKMVNKAVIKCITKTLSMMVWWHQGVLRLGAYLASGHSLYFLAAAGLLYPGPWWEPSPPGSPHPCQGGQGDGLGLKVYKREVRPATPSPSTTLAPLPPGSSLIPATTGPNWNVSFLCNYEIN